MKKLLLVSVLAIGLAGCGHSSSPPPAPPPLPPPPPSASPWVITQGSAPARLQLSGTQEAFFDFPLCASASACWVSYVEQPFGPLIGRSSVTLSYSITGAAPAFNNLSPGNNCGGPPALSLLLHQAGDNLSGVGAYAFYRWFSTPKAQPLALGDHTLTVPLTVDQWVPVYAGTPAQNVAGFAAALFNLGSIGFGLGGGCFAAHGVSISSGSARFTIKGFGVQ